jgi:drug/metabolite transporter (DMT)-like permease
VARPSRGSFIHRLLVVLRVLIYATVTAQTLPAITPVFWAYALVGGAAQILATMCVVALFAHRNFAVGITFKKTEVLMAASIGLLILGEGVTWLAFGAILIGLAGVMLLSDLPGASQDAWHKRILNRAVGFGLASGVLFACSGIWYRVSRSVAVVGER